MLSAKKEATTIEPWAMAIGAAIAVLVMAIAGFTAWNRSHTTDLEKVVTPTAVGDTHFVPKPSSGAGSIGLKYQGQQLDMVGESKVRDAKLIQAATDDSGVYWLYSPESDEDKLPKDRYYMKLGDNEFMQVATE